MPHSNLLQWIKYDGFLSHFDSSKLLYVFVACVLVCDKMCDAFAFNACGRIESRDAPLPAGCCSMTCPEMPKSETITKAPANDSRMSVERESSEIKRKKRRIGLK